MRTTKLHHRRPRGEHAGARFGHDPRGRRLAVLPRTESRRQVRRDDRLAEKWPERAVEDQRRHRPLGPVRRRRPGLHDGQHRRHRHDLQHRRRHGKDRLEALPTPATRRSASRTTTDPFATPAVANGVVYTLSRKGDVFALDARDGKVIWAHNIMKEDDARQPGYGGFAGSPLILGDKLILNGSPGGMALDAKTGKTLGSRAWGLEAMRRRSHSRCATKLILRSILRGH